VLKTATSPEDFHRRIIEEFDVYESVGCDNRGTVLFTGYCTPEYRASLKPTEEYRYPLYKLPPDDSPLAVVKGEKGQVLGRMLGGKIVPYPTRAELESGKMLAGLELVYLRDRLEAYLVHVQGSARLILPDGSVMEVGYAGSNGREYKSLRDMLMKDRKLSAEKCSLMGIKEYFRQHPEELEKYIMQNDRFIFFTEMPGGPYGSLGVPVTPMASLATDKSGKREIYPRGCIAFIQTELPFADDGSVKKRKYSGFVLDQDTGGAIRSAGRADVYMGIGPIGERLAGHTLSEGRIYYIFVKEPLLPKL